MKQMKVSSNCNDSWFTFRINLSALLSFYQVFWNDKTFWTRWFQGLDISHHEQYQWLNLGGAVAHLFSGQNSDYKKWIIPKHSSIVSICTFPRLREALSSISFQIPHMGANRSALSLKARACGLVFVTYWVPNTRYTRKVRTILA